MKVKILPGKILNTQCKDFGLVLILLVIIFSRFINQDILYKLLIVFSVITIVIPIVYKPFAWLWFTLANILSLIFPKIFLTIIFILFVVPVAFFIKLFGKDLIILKQFKKKKESVFKDRNYLFSSKDLKFPY